MVSEWLATPTPSEPFLFGRGQPLKSAFGVDQIFDIDLGVARVDVVAAACLRDYQHRLGPQRPLDRG
jgi:hypothetical protein